MKALTRHLQLCCGAWALAASVAAHAQGVQSLERFMQTTTSGRAEFTQVVTAPAKDGRPARSKTSSGSFAFVRPNQFRFDYRKPFAQTIVADGRTLWLYDPDMNQATARPQAAALGNTPASLIASATDLSVLRQAFNLQSEPDQEGLHWVMATPVSRDATIQSVRVGLRDQGATVVLVRLEIRDAFGQQSVLSFDRFEANPAQRDPALFQFVPPPHTEVIRP